MADRSGTRLCRQGVKAVYTGSILVSSVFLLMLEAVRLVEVGGVSGRTGGLLYVLGGVLTFCEILF